MTEGRGPEANGGGGGPGLEAADRPTAGRPARDPGPRGQWPWIVGAVVLVLASAVALRHGTNILDKDAVFDERYIRTPIEDLIDRGWSVETAIDFKETKGPTLIWTYALGGAALGGTLNDLRMVSVLFFVGGIAPLLLLARRSGVEGPGLLLAAGFYVLLPHQPVLGQLLMSEPSFNFAALWLCWVVVWGVGTWQRTPHPVAGPVLFAIILCLLLHLRIHAVALAGAACLVAAERDRWRSWPWLLAAALAGLSRVPLWIRWGGLVAPEFESAHALGLGGSSLVYLAAAFCPMLALLWWPALRDVRYRCRRWLVGAGAAAGLVLGLAATPDLGERVPIVGREAYRFLGLVAHVVRDLVPDALQGPALVLLAAVGAGALGALAIFALDRPTREPIGVVLRLQLWTFLVGWAMYALTRSVVYDRYLLPWAMLMPIVWVFALPARARWLQGLLLAGIQAWYVYQLLIRT